MGLPHEHGHERDGQESSQSLLRWADATRDPRQPRQYVPGCSAAACWSICTLSDNRCVATAKASTSSARTRRSATWNTSEPPAKRQRSAAHARMVASPALTANPVTKAAVVGAAAPRAKARTYSAAADGSTVPPW
jgi:hypothetical protein